MTTVSGVWLPIVTPFREGAVDFVSYEKLIEHYLAAGISGIFPSRNCSSRSASCEVSPGP